MSSPPNAPTATPAERSPAGTDGAGWKPGPSGQGASSAVGPDPAKGHKGGLTAASKASAGAGPGREAPTQEVADEMLVRRFRGGDLAAGDALVQRHHGALVRYLQRLVGAGAAEELHQQTWLSVLDHLDRFDPATAGGGFKAWLFRIATNKANDHWRSRGREKVAKEGLKRVTGELQPAAGQRLEGVEQEEKLRRAIEMLPEAQRQVLVLRYYSNLKFVEIADILGCPLNTALGRVHKALIKLRQLMAE